MLKELIPKTRSFLLFLDRILEKIENKVEPVPEEYEALIFRIAQLEGELRSRGGK